MNFGFTTAVYGLAIFAGAFLTFQVQPVIAKFILPYFGGSPSVWTTCLLFFQGGLLAGYVYAHAIVGTLRHRRVSQVCVHLVLLCASAFFLPGSSSRDSMMATANTPVLGILSLLCLSVGFPYLILSASSPLLQHWYASGDADRSPYRLFAISNLGSLLGLLTYPLLVEPFSSLEQQLSSWSFLYVGYGALALVCASCFLHQQPTGPEHEPEESEGGIPSVSRVQFSLWVALSMCGSILLLGTTSHLTQEVAAVPFLWVLPLAIYLTTFILSFDHPRWYRRAVWIPLMLWMVLMMFAWILFADSSLYLLAPIQIAFGLVSLLCSCMVCHGELARSKPLPSRLTTFYLSIAAGGVLGGLFVALLSPRIFRDFWELPVAFLFLILLTGLVLLGDRHRIKAVIPRGRAAVSGWIILIVLMAGSLVYQVKAHRSETIESSRNFYGVTRVVEATSDEGHEFRMLIHGQIVHGMEFLSGPWANRATTYYGEGSGVEAAFLLHPRSLNTPRQPLRIGVVGLGVGTVSSYAHEGDIIRFYEINDHIIETAWSSFSYLKSCPAKVELVEGDGRISLQRELQAGKLGNFDLLFLDAFSSDSIPMHLLTKEAFAIYLQHLREDGVLLVHISNRHLDLSDPVRNLARELQRKAVLIQQPSTKVPNSKSSWVVLCSEESMHDRLVAHSNFQAWERSEPRKILWTDNYSNLLEVIRWKQDP